jgi:ferredoxin
VGLRIEVDRAACMGSGNCAFLAPGTFDLDDEMKAIVLDSDGDPPEKVHLAADGCPTNAIRVTEGG